MPLNVPRILARHQRAVYFLFGIYAGLLFVATHWPALRIPGPFERTDLIAHFSCFGTWAFLMMLCQRWGPAASWRNIALSVVVALLYAGFDEGLQAIPALKRTCAWDDYGANAIGIGIAATVMATLGKSLLRDPSLNQ